jgi:hypothetical protein
MGHAVPRSNGAGLARSNGAGLARSNGAGLAGLDFGAEPPRRTGRQAGRALARGHVLEAHGQGARSRAERDDDRHLYDRRRRLRGHDALDSGSLVRGEQPGEITDLGPDAIGGPANRLTHRPGARQYLHDHLGELPGQHSGLARGARRGVSPSRSVSVSPSRSVSVSPSRGVSLGDGVSPGRGGLGKCQRWRDRRGRASRVGQGRQRAADVRGSLARRRARGTVGLAVVRRPACGDRDEPRPGIRRLGRGALAGSGRRVRREGARRHVSSSRSGECERPRTPLAAAFVSGSGWTRLYLRVPTFRRPAWLRSFHGVDE